MAATTGRAARSRACRHQFAAMGIEVIAITDAGFKRREAGRRHRGGAGAEAGHHRRRCRSTRRPPPAAYKAAADAGREARLHGEHAPRASTPARTMSASSRPTITATASPRPHLMAEGARRQGRDRPRLPRRRLLRHPAALRRLQEDDRRELSRHQDRRRAGHRRPGLRRRRRARRPAAMLTVQSGHQGHLGGLGRAGRRRDRGGARRPAATTSSSPRSISARTSRSRWRRAASSRASARSGVYDQGVTEALLAGYGLLGKQAPAFVALPALPVDQGQPARCLADRLPPARPVRLNLARQPPVRCSGPFALRPPCQRGSL